MIARLTVAGRGVRPSSSEQTHLDTISITWITFSRGFVFFFLEPVFCSLLFRANMSQSEIPLNRKPNPDFAVQGEKIKDTWLGVEADTYSLEFKIGSDNLVRVFLLPPPSPSTLRHSTHYLL